MKLLLTTAVFHPTVGGVQNLVSVLGRELVHMGHQITVVTTQASPVADQFPFRVLRNPNPVRLVGAYCAVEGVIHFGGVRLGWPAFFQRNRSVIVHGIWPRSANAEGLISRRLRRCWLAQAQNVCPSEAVGYSLGIPFRVIPNAYDVATFQFIPQVKRDRDLVFVGRLLFEKGPDILLKSVAVLAKCHRSLTVTIVGSGPMRAALEEQARTLGIQGVVRFSGVKQGSELATILNQHRIMVVPSRWQEPFGIVALEGIACGCAVVGSNGGGLPDAIGPCGVTFPNGDGSALTAILDELLRNDTLRTKFRVLAPAHLTKHHPHIVAEAYLERLGKGE